MDQELRLGIVYENNLDTDKFARMFNNKAQSYKFYWFEAILNLVKTEERDFTFEEVIDEMICEAYLMKRPYGHDGMPLGMRLGTRAGVRLHRQPLSLRAVCIPTCRIRPGMNGFFSTRAVRILGVLPLFCHR